MVTDATKRKRQDLRMFIARVLEPEPAVRAVVGIGSIANGLARPDSDIDIVVFLDPFDLYIVPAEALWCPEDSTFHSIFSEDVDHGSCVPLDVLRLDMAQWADPAYRWPEPRRAELQAGWVAFDRDGAVSELVAARTAYTDDVRIAKLDEAITWLDQHLGEDRPRRNWESLGPVIAHDRLQAAYGYLVQALFAYNRRWRPWRNREMGALLTLPWLPKSFEKRILPAGNAPTLDYDGYLARVSALRSLFDDVIGRLVSDDDYGDDVVSEAFIRSHDEPGRAWNLDAWNERHLQRVD